MVFLNSKKRQCNKYYNGVQNSKTLDVKNIYFVYKFISDAQSQVIRDNTVIIQKIAGPHLRPFSRRLEMSPVNPAANGWKNEAVKREKWALHFIFFVQDTLGL